MGIAAEARMATIATQMMSSTRVRPDSGVPMYEKIRRLRQSRRTS